MKRICIIDGQGGGIGSVLIKSLRNHCGENVELIGLGANDIATVQMLKAGANRGVTGENAILRSVVLADCILGPIGMTWANSMSGEITPKIAEAIMSCQAIKVLIPIFQEKTLIAGLVTEPLPHMVEIAVGMVKEVINNV